MGIAVAAILIDSHCMTHLCATVVNKSWEESSCSCLFQNPVCLFISSDDDNNHLYFLIIYIRLVFLWDYCRSKLWEVVFFVRRKIKHATLYVFRIEEHNIHDNSEALFFVLKSLWLSNGFLWPQGTRCTVLIVVIFVALTTVCTWCLLYTNTPIYYSVH